MTILHHRQWCVCMRLRVSRSFATQTEILPLPSIFLLAFHPIINDRNCHWKSLLTTTNKHPALGRLTFELNQWTFKQWRMGSCPPSPWTQSLPPPFKCKIELCWGSWTQSSQSLVVNTILVRPGKTAYGSGEATGLLQEATGHPGHPRWPP